jgi:alkylation response protein AidB-like acyl-CoA dehydrogenase
VTDAFSVTHREPERRPALDFRYTPEQQALRKEFDDFFREEMQNLPAALRSSMESLFEVDECWEFHVQMAKKLAARGWISMAWPEEYGGRDAPLMEQFIFNEVRGYHRAPGIDPMGVGMLAPTLLATASDEQKREHLPYMARAERFWCQLWSEPNAGSDLASLVTRAVRAGDEYIVNGQKIWTSGAHRAHWGFMLVRTNPEEKRSRGLSFVLVDMATPGITVKPLYSMAKGHMFNEVFLDDVRVPVRNRVGEENEGWVSSQMTSNFERSMIDLFSNARRDLEDLVQFCKEATWGGQSLASNPLVRQRLAQLAIDIEAGLAYSHSVVWNQIKGGLMTAAPLAAGAKVLVTELTQRLNYTGCDIMGQYGQVAQSKWAQMRGRYQNYYQQVMGLNMGGGTSEIMRNLVASMGLGLPRSW